MMKYKYQFMTMHLFEYKALENYLQEMSEKGWFVDRLRNSYIRFVKGEPKKQYYHIGFDDKPGIFVIPYLEGKHSSYTEFMESFGYTYVSSIGVAQLFVSETENSLFSEPAIDEKAFRSATFKDELGKTIMPFGLLLFIGCIQMSFFSPDKLADNFYLMFYVFLTITSMYGLVQLIPYLRYCRHRQLKSSGVNFKARVYQIILPIVFIAGMVSLAMPPRAAQLTITIIGLCIALRFLLYIFVNRTTKYRNIWVGILLVLFWLGYNYVFMNDVFNTVNEPTIQRMGGSPFMSAKDFGKEVRDPYMDTSESVLLSMQYYGDQEVYYTYYVAKDTPLQSYCINQIIKAENYNIDEYTQIGDIKLYKADSVSSSYPFQAAVLVKGNQALVVNEYKEAYLTYFKNHV